MRRKIYAENNGEILVRKDSEFVFLRSEEEPNEENSKVQRNEGIQLVRDRGFEKVATQLFREENPKTNIINVYGENAYSEIKKFRDSTARISNSIFSLQTVFLGFISMESFANIFWRIAESLVSVYSRCEDTAYSRLRYIEIVEQRYNLQYCAQNLGFHYQYPMSYKERYQRRVIGEEAKNIEEAIQSLKKAFLQYDTKVFCALGYYKEDEQSREILRWFVEHKITDFIIIVDSGDGPIRF